MRPRTFSRTACIILCVGVFASPYSVDGQQRRRALTREDERLRRDQQNTIAQGTGLGAVIGGVVGGLVGALTGDKQNAVAGAVIGAGFGAMAGNEHGKNVAQKKAAYARTEDRVDLQIQRARSWTQAARQQNQALGVKVAKLDQQSRHLRAQYQQNKATRNELAVAQSTARRERAELQQKIQTISSQITIQRQLLAQGQKSGNSLATLQQLSGEITALSAEKAQLEARNKKLQEIDNRLGI